MIKIGDKVVFSVNSSTGRKPIKKIVMSGIVRDIRMPFKDYVIDRYSIKIHDDVIKRKVKKTL